MARGFRRAYQGVFLLLFFASLALMTEEGLRRFPVRLLLELDPLSALAVLASSWLLPAGLAIALAVVALTVVFGRAFCGWICPLGTLHHLASWLTRGLRRGPDARANRWRPHFRLKYLLLAGLLVAALAGTLSIGLLDPMSLATRSFASSLLPALRAAAGAEGVRPRTFAGAWLTGAVFLGLLAANRWVARWWCRALCPLGALLGLGARAAVFRVHVDPERCNACHLCARDCQGADEPFAAHRVSECHVCLNCVAACPEGAIAYRPFAPAAAPHGGVDLPRRQLVGAALAGAALLPLLRATSAEAAPEAIRPPGALPEDAFLARCVRCGACVNACPTSALQPSLVTAGLAGLYTPVLVPRRGWCEPSCTRCGEVCPTGAIERLTPETKGWTRGEGDGTPVRIGTAFFDWGRCLPWAMAVPCVVCEEVCPTSPKAIGLEPADAVRVDGRVVRVQRPRLDPDRCIGCGLCEAKCPVASPAAIRVTRAGESRHPEGGLTLARRALVGAALVASLAPLAPASPAARARPPALAGTWYPDGRGRLVAGAHFLLRLAADAPRPAGRPVALVAPHAGWSYSGVAAAAAFRLLAPGDFERVVVVAPSHYGAFRGYGLDDAASYRTPMGDVPLCDGALAVLRGPEARVQAAATEREHAVEIELPFLQATLGRFCLVPVLAGDTDEAAERAFAERLARLDDGRTLFVFSSDFAHYGPRFDFQPFGALTPATLARVRAMDERGAALLAGADARGFRRYLRETGNTICGRHGLSTLLELLPRIAPDARGVVLAHYASGDLPGLRDDSSVSYVAMAFPRGEAAGGPATPPLVAPPALADAPAGTPALPAEEGARLVRLARAALDTELRGTDDLGRALAAWPAGPGRELRQGVFVTLNRRDAAEIRARGRLRGCIGQPEPTFPLYYGTVQAALDAALRDPRFEPVSAAELGRLAVEVTVLSPRRPVASWSEIRLGTHGIVLQKGDKAALFLPQVAPENGWTLEQTLSALAEKAGLPPDGWRDGARFSVFTGQAFEEHR